MFMVMRVRIIAAAMVAAWACTALEAGQKSVSPLHVYLPRTVQAVGPQLTLGDVGIIRGDAQDCRKAAAIPMGRAPFSRETIVVDRPTILSRLAAHGFAAKAVRLTGAQKVTVGRDEKIFPAVELLKAAEDFLTKRRPGPAGCGWRLVGKVSSPLTSPGGGGDVVLKVSLAEASPPGHVKLRISAVSSKIELARRELLFKLTYPHREAVTKAPVPAGKKITTENTAIRTVRRDSPPKTNWTAPFGTVAVRNLKAGAVLADASVRAPKAPIAVQRNRPVIMVVRGFGFVITAKALALQDGRPGQFIRVRNVDSQRIVVARVRHDGTVEPAIGR